MRALRSLKALLESRKFQTALIAVGGQIALAFGLDMPEAKLAAIIGSAVTLAAVIIGIAVEDAAEKANKPVGNSLPSESSDNPLDNNKPMVILDDEE